MTNNLRKVKQDLCSLAKRTKDFKYTDSALFMFLLTGLVMVRNNLFSTTANKEIKTQKEEISTSIKNIHQKFKETRRENDKLLKDANLELIQLMEQGDHVVKSPWSSWQFGLNYMYSRWGGAYKGRGDKAAKYPFNGIFTRGDWGETGILFNRRKNFVTPSISTSTVGSRSYGLASCYMFKNLKWKFR